MTALEKFIAENQEKLVKIHWNDIVNNYSENIGLSKILLNDLGKDEYFNPLKDFFKSINNTIILTVLENTLWVLLPIAKQKNFCVRKELVYGICLVGCLFFSSISYRKLKLLSIC